jgi:serine/threonine-protein kinase
MVGDVVAERYRLEQLIGTGGHSSVYRAHDTLLERSVALKVLHEQLTADEDHVERFKREARAVAQLAHPNIVTVIDRGERDGRQYIVFEYIDGENLKELIRREGPLPVRRALQLGLQIARALAFAHRQGLVHRDVKPQNVLLAPTGQAKVTDFGIARGLEVGGLTHTGTVLGTSEYIAPEQARGERVVAQSDVYALATVIYELLTGNVPFAGDNFVAVALRHVNDPPPHVRERRQDVSPRLDQALQRAMAKDPDERFATMDDFIVELEACLLEVAQSAPGESLDETTIIPGDVVVVKPPRPPKRRRWPTALVLLVLIPAAVVGAIVLLGAIDFGSEGGSGTTTRSTTTTAPPSELRAVPLDAFRTWDPFGDENENDAGVPNATDGDVSSYWSTEGYDSTLADLDKEGVGIVLDAGSRTTSQVRVRSDTPGYLALIQAGSSASGPFHPVSASRQMGGDTTVQLTNPVTNRYLVVWITQLAHPDRYRVHLNEVTAKGPSP